MSAALLIRPDQIFTSPTTGERVVKFGPETEVLRASATNFVAFQSLDDGLIWSVEEASHAMPQRECEAYAKTMRTAGFTGWELVTRRQLVSRVDDTRSNPAIDVALFPRAMTRWYWTRTPWAPSPEGCAWFVSFSSGGSGASYRGGDGFVRAVRPGQLLAFEPLRVTKAKAHKVRAISGGGRV